MAVETPTPPAVGYLSQGVTTVVWGTTGLAAFVGTPGSDITAANSGYYILTNYRQRQKIDVEYGENGTGMECRRTFITHGNVWDLEVEDNTTMTPPVVGTTITCYDILAKANNIGLLPTPVARGSWTATVVSSEYTAAPKRPGMRTLVVENLILVDANP